MKRTAYTFLDFAKSNNIEKQGINLKMRGKLKIIE